jgi:hypothetical protein
MVTLTFQKQGEGTLMTLVHSDLPDTDRGRAHEKGWNYFLDIFRERFGIGSCKDNHREVALVEEVVKQ